MNFDELKADQDRILAEYNDRFRPHEYRQVFFREGAGDYKLYGSYTDSYFEVAKLLLEGLANGQLLEGMYSVPALFICHHYVELQIKYALLHVTRLKSESVNASDSEGPPVKEGHILQVYWDDLTRELKAKVPSVVAAHLGLPFVGKFVADFDKHKIAIKSRYAVHQIGAKIQSRPAELGISFQALLVNLLDLREILEALDSWLVEAHGWNQENRDCQDEQNQEWQDEMNSW